MTKETSKLAWLTLHIDLAILKVSATNRMLRWFSIVASAMGMIVGLALLGQGPLALAIIGVNGLLLAYHLLPEWSYSLYSPRYFDDDFRSDVDEWFAQVASDANEVLARLIELNERLGKRLIWTTIVFVVSLALAIALFLAG